MRDSSDQSEKLMVTTIIRMILHRMITYYFCYMNENIPPFSVGINISSFQSGKSWQRSAFEEILLRLVAPETAAVTVGVENQNQTLEEQENQNLHGTRELELHGTRGLELELHGARVSKTLPRESRRWQIFRCRR